MPSNVVDIPESSATVSVSIIDSCRMVDMPWNLFFGPEIQGMDKWHCSGYSFLITHRDVNGKIRRLLFDLAPAKDLQKTLPPWYLKLINGWLDNGTKITVTEQVHDILAEQDIHFSADDAMLWSRPHSDHLGNVTLFPKDVPLLVGPGVQAAHGSGYPENEHSAWFTKDLVGRKVVDLDFDQTTIKAGGMTAIDHFGDGSFYILDAPGHSFGHLNGLARVKEDSFIYLGADAYHHASQLRPNAREPLPADVDLGSVPVSLPCPGDLLTRLYAKKEDHLHDHYGSFCENAVPGKTPILTVGWWENGYSVAKDPELAAKTIASNPRIRSR